MSRGTGRDARRAQVLVYPWGHPGRFLSVVVLVVAAAAAWGFRAPSSPDATDRPSAHGGLYLALPAPPIRVRVVAPPLPPPGGALFRDGTLFAPRAGIVDATVIGHTLEMGASGPQIPISMGFALDGAALPADALGRGMRLGETRSVAVPFAARVSFVTAARYDAYGAMDDHVYVRSDLPGGFRDSSAPRALTLVDGDRVPYPERGGYGGQPSLTRLLGRMVAADGRLELRPNQAVLAFEYTSDFHHPAADFQDLVLLVTFTGEK